MNKLEEFLKNNYPGGYIDHYLAMYSIHQSGMSNENFENQNSMYVAIEGKTEFQKLKNEVMKAKQQADLDKFLELAKIKWINDITLDDLTRMFEAIQLFKI